MVIQLRGKISDLPTGNDNSIPARQKQRSTLVVKRQQDWKHIL